MTRPLQTREIEAFNAVMQTGTATAAAALLNTTQPSISRLLSQAQAAAQVCLFERQGGRLRPTPEAHVLHAAVQRHAQGLMRIEQTLVALRQSGVGHLRVGCTPALALGVMPPVLADFAGEFPRVHLRLHTESTSALREAMEHGLHDLALSTESLESGPARGEPLHTSRAVCVMPRAHPLAARARIETSDLAGQVLITLEAADPICAHLQTALASRGTRPAATIETNYSVTVCRLALQGLGVGIVNPYVASVFGDGLAVRPWRDACAVALYFAHAPQQAPSAAARRFEALLRKRLKGSGTR